MQEQSENAIRKTQKKEILNRVSNDAALPTSDSFFFFFLFFFRDLLFLFPGQILVCYRLGDIIQANNRKPFSFFFLEMIEVVRYRHILFLIIRVPIITCALL